MARTTEYELLYDNFSRSFQDFFWHGRLAEALILKAQAILVGGAGITYGSKTTYTDNEVYACVKGHVATVDNAPDGVDGKKHWIKIAPTTAGAWALGATYTMVDSLPVANEKNRLHNIDKQCANWVLERANNPSVENFLMPEKEFQPFIENEALYMDKGRTMSDADVVTIVSNQYRNFSRAKFDASY